MDAIQAISDFDKIKEQILPKLSNRKNSQDFLNGKVVFPVVDLALTFYIDLGEALVHVTEDVLRAWNISRETLRETAMANLDPSHIGLAKLADTGSEQSRHNNDDLQDRDWAHTSNTCSHV